MNGAGESVGMTNGLGAGFAAASLLAVLAAAAGVLAFVGVFGVLVDPGGRRVPRGFQYAAVVLLAVAAAVGGVGVIALFDEAPLVAALLAGLVPLPLLVAAARVVSGDAVRGRVPVAATVAVAWALPFLVALGVLAALTVGTSLPPVVTGPTAVVVGTGGALALAGRAGTVVADA
jgi:hypothetical protein